MVKAWNLGVCSLLKFQAENSQLLSSPLGQFILQNLAPPLIELMDTCDIKIFVKRLFMLLGLALTSSFYPHICPVWWRALNKFSKSVM